MSEFFHLGNKTNKQTKNTSLAYLMTYVTEKQR